MVGRYIRGQVRFLQYHSHVIVLQTNSSSESFDDVSQSDDLSVKETFHTDCGE
jgi:hypothetical protein